VRLEPVPLRLPACASKFGENLLDTSAANLFNKALVREKGFVVIYGFIYIPDSLIRTTCIEDFI
jgi:hypothetical protein